MVCVWGLPGIGPKQRPAKERDVCRRSTVIVIQLRSHSATPLRRAKTRSLRALRTPFEPPGLRTTVGGAVFSEGGVPGYYLRAGQYRRRQTAGKWEPIELTLFNG